MAKKNNVLVIGDLHAPAEHPKYFDFCRSLAKEFSCNKFVQIGDLFDMQASSYHESDPDLPSAGDELAAAKRSLKKWMKAFPKLTITSGNHDMLPARKLKTLGVSKHFLRSYNDVIGAPSGWEFVYSIEIDDVLYKHVPQGSTLTALLRAAERNTMSTVTGHLHSIAGVTYSAGFKYKVFAAATGCGVDRHHLAMAYGKESAFKPVLGACVIEQGVRASFIPMDL